MIFFGLSFRGEEGAGEEGRFFKKRPSSPANFFRTPRKLFPKKIDSGAFLGYNNIGGRR